MKEKEHITLMLNLTPDEENRVQNARASGIDVDALLKGVIAALPGPKAQSTFPNRTAELFVEWEREDAEISPEELEAELRDWAAFKQNMNEARLANGERPIYCPRDGHGEAWTKK